MTRDSPQRNCLVPDLRFHSMLHVHLSGAAAAIVCSVAVYIVLKWDEVFPKMQQNAWVVVVFTLIVAYAMPQCAPESVKLILKLVPEDYQGFFDALFGTEEKPAKKADAPDVRTMLKEVGLSSFANKFIEDGYENLEILSKVTDTDLKELGLRGGHRKKLLEKLAQAEAKRSSKDQLRKTAFEKESLEVKFVEKKKFLKQPTFESVVIGERYTFKRESSYDYDGKCIEGSLVTVVGKKEHNERIGEVSIRVRWSNDFEYWVHAEDLRPQLEKDDRAMEKRAREVKACRQPSFASVVIGGRYIFSRQTSYEYDSKCVEGKVVTAVSKKTRNERIGEVCVQVRWNSGFVYWVHVKDLCTYECFDSAAKSIS